VALALYVTVWLALGSYELTRIRDDGIWLLVVTTSVAVGLSSLVVVGSRPATFNGVPIGGGITWLGVCGCLLIVPLAVPVGLASAWFIVNGVLEQPHSLLQALRLGHGWRTALAYGFLAALPFLVGSVFLALGRQPHSSAAR
jgi:hypothetical protein